MGIFYLTFLRSHPWGCVLCKSGIKGKLLAEGMSLRPFPGNSRFVPMAALDIKQAPSFWVVRALPTRRQVTAPPLCDAPFQLHSVKKVQRAGQ